MRLKFPLQGWLGGDPNLTRRGRGQNFPYKDLMRTRIKSLTLPSRGINCITVTSYKDAKSTFTNINPHFLHLVAARPRDNPYLCVYHNICTQQWSIWETRGDWVLGGDDDKDEILSVKCFRARTRNRFWRGRGALLRPRPIAISIPNLKE